MLLLLKRLDGKKKTGTTWNGLKPVFVWLTLASSSSMKPCPRDLQKNLTVPWRTSSSILPDIEIVRVRRVMITSGRRRPSGIGDAIADDGESEPRRCGVVDIFVADSRLGPIWQKNLRTCNYVSVTKPTLLC